jgi:hypothetical protein
VVFALAGLQSCLPDEIVGRRAGVRIPAIADSDSGASRTAPERAPEPVLPSIRESVDRHPLSRNLRGRSMETERVSMRKVREVLRLRHELKLSVREVAEATGVGKTAVAEYVRRAKVIGLTWPVAPEIDDAELELHLRRGALEQPLPDWSGAHIAAIDFLGGTPKAEPGINRTYQELADHYDFVVLPARIRKPRDKAKVEAAVGIVERSSLMASASSRIPSMTT